MTLHRRHVLQLAAGAVALPAVSRIARAQAYPSRPVRIIVGVARRRRHRHRRALGRSMAVGAARPAIRGREPRRRAAAISPPRRWCGRRPTATRCCCVTSPTRSTPRSMTSSISISSRDIAPVAGIMRGAQRHGGQSVVSGQDGCRSSSPMPRPIRARSTWRRPASAPRRTWPASCSSRWPASTWFMWPIAASRRRSST